MPGLQNMKTRNDRTECVENQCAHSNPPTHHTDLLAHRQSEYPVAQTVDSPPPQTSHVESEQTTSERLRKRPTQLNTPNIFVPDLVQVFPNASKVQQLGRCVPALGLA